MSDQVTMRDTWGNLAVTLSVKGIVLERGKLWLRKNERGDWELPGGRLDEGEQPEQTIVREIQEELGRDISEPRLVDVFVWKKDFGVTSHIGIITFTCEVRKVSEEFELEGEAGPVEFKQFNIEEALHLSNFAEVYKRALHKL